MRHTYMHCVFIGPKRTRTKIVVSPCIELLGRNPLRKLRAWRNVFVLILAFPWVLRITVSHRLQGNFFPCSYP